MVVFLPVKDKKIGSLTVGLMFVLDAPQYFCWFLVVCADTFK